MLYTSLEEARMTYLTNQMLTANCGSAQFKPKPNVETIYDYFLGHTGSKDSTLVSAHRGLVTDIIPENVSHDEDEADQSRVSGRF